MIEHDGNGINNLSINTIINENNYRFTTKSYDDGDLKYIDGQLFMYRGDRFVHLEISISENYNTNYLLEELKIWYEDIKDDISKEQGILNKYPEAREAKKLYNNVIKTLEAMEKITDSNYVE